MTRPGGSLLRSILALVTGVALVAGALLVLYQALARGPAAQQGAAAVGAAPSLQGPGLDGERHDLAQLRGRVVIVNVWASWCAPCRKELPLLLRTAERYQDLELLGLNSNDRAAAARDFLASIGAGTMANVADPEGRHAVEWGARGVPETFVVDRGGRVVARHSGAVDADWVASVVVPLVSP